MLPAGPVRTPSLDGTPKSLTDNIMGTNSAPLSLEEYWDIIQTKVLCLSIQV